MNEIRLPDSQATELATIREIVARQMLPDFVTGFAVELGDFDGDPATWIELKLSGSDELGLPELQRRADILVPFQQELTNELHKHGQDRFVFYRVSYAETAT